MLNIEIQTGDVLAALDDITAVQLPFALSGAVYDTAVNVQTAVFGHEQDIFTVRQSSWLEKSTKMVQRPTKHDPTAILQIVPPGSNGSDRADILTKFEDDTEKVSRTGGMIAVPTSNVKRNKRDIIPRSSPLRPKALGPFVQVGAALRGQNGAFIITMPSGRQAIMRRDGRGNVKVLYWLVPRVEITPDLHFYDIATEVVSNQWASNFERRWAEALASAK